MRYKSKPKFVDAWRVPVRAADGPPAEPIPDWLTEAIKKGIVVFLSQGTWRVTTKTGVAFGNAGDWIIKGPSDLYPCAHDIFEQSYELDVDEH
jgi:hypothetical protein